MATTTAADSLVSITQRGVELLDEEGDVVRRLNATEALALSDLLTARRDALEEAVQRTQWRDRVEKIVNDVLHAGVTPPKRITVETGYDPSAEVMWYEVGAVETFAEVMGEPLNARLRWPGNGDHADSVTFFVVADGVEYYAWEDDAALAAALTDDAELVTA